MENTVGQPQIVQVPNYSGVNIQIFNPSVAAPGSTTQQSPISTTNYATMPTYPQNYYTNNFSPTVTPQAPVTQSVPQLPSSQESVLTPSPQANPIVSQAPSAPVAEPVKKNTEVREVVELTDDYVKSLENYLNNQDKQVRLIAAKEILARLQEDDSRKNDEALNALLNKMLQDPYQPIKFIAMGAFEARAASGNQQSVALLQGIQAQKETQGEDSIKASNVLLKMASTTTKKEFEVTKKPEKPTKK
jgi:hypothetical protein